MKSISKQALSALLSSSCVFAVSAGVSAQDADESKMVLEEILVTSQKREQSLSDVPISVSAVSGDMMVQAGMNNPQDLQFAVPNFTMTETGIGTNLFIRGIGSGINQGFEQSVGVYLDGVHYGRSQQARGAFLDVERVEVLRGPQSILLGKNAVAGALNIVSARPTEEFEGSVYGSYEFKNKTFETTGHLSGALTEDGSVRARVAGRYRDADGHIYNATLDRPEAQRKDVSVRATVEMDVSENLMLRAKAEIHDFESLGRNIEVYGEEPGGSGATYAQILANFTGDARNLDNIKDGNRTSNGDFSNNKQEAFQLTAEYDMGGPTLTSITAYTKFGYDELCDCDFTGAPVFDVPLWEDYDQFSQELRIVSEGGQTFDYIIGGYYQSSDHEFRDRIRISSSSILPPLVAATIGSPAGLLLYNTGVSRLATVDAESWALFGQGTYQMSDELRLTLGGRLSKESKDGYRNLALTDTEGNSLSDPLQIGTATALYGGLFLLDLHTVEGEVSETKFSPQVNLQWDASDDTMLYASWVKGSKSSGFDFRANNQGPYASMEESFQFSDEKATNFEAGGKMRLADGAAELNFAAYYTKYNDLQVSIFDGTLGFNVGNAAKAELKGLEIDGRWLINENLMMRGSIAFSDFEFKDFPNGQCYTGQTPNSPAPWVGLCDYTGMTNQMVSDWQGTFALDHTMPISDDLEIRSTFDVFFTDEYHAAATLDPAQLQGSYANLNLRVALADMDNMWELALYGANLTNNKTLSFGGNTPLSGGTFGVVSHYNFVNPGRTIALQARLNF